MQDLVSIVIRTYNESKYINICLNAIEKQKYKNYEVIIIDSGSTDDTIPKIKTRKNIKYFHYKQKDYIPGKALNFGVKKSKGDLILFLSAHCIPCNDDWLENLIKPFKQEKIAGVYGRQIPLPHSKPEDRRDLMNTFGIEDKIQKKDFFFHNANSVVRSSIVKKYKFSEKATNIEDRIWAKEIIDQGYHLYYSSEAKVFHHHGIHQYGNDSRVITSDKVINDYSLIKDSKLELKINDAQICVCIPIKKFGKKGGSYLINDTLSFLNKYSFLDKTYLYTNDKINLKDINNDKSCEILSRPEYLDKPKVDTYSVLKEFKNQCNEKSYFPDIIIYLEEVYPLRSDLNLEKFISNLLNSDFDSIVPSFQENRMILSQSNQNNFSLINSGFVPSSIGSDLFVASKGTLFITYADSLNKNLVDQKVGTIIFDENSDIFKKYILKK